LDLFHVNFFFAQEQSSHRTNKQRRHFPSVLFCFFSIVCMPLEWIGWSL